MKIIVLFKKENTITKKRKELKTPFDLKNE